MSISIIQPSDKVSLTNFPFTIIPILIIIKSLLIRLSFPSGLFGVIEVNFSLYYQLADLHGIHWAFLKELL